ncbi:uncharacterized protein LOC110816700 isoform X2 [Carica papaya]|uniref:uncharacterized protein LOC110816700 isoform X2 n=1 Tax=Carica papaya TaxID=3649 RepID=UPI000B8C9D45|nr:uncharacterized protein LOC110816700 isoform X2 [Carica papaya]
MVSFQASLSPTRRKTVLDFEDLSKKRKWQEPHVEETFHKRSNTDTPKSPFDIELHLETPLPLEWQRCLDIQSGQIHFYNTRTQKRTSRDPRSCSSPEPPSPSRHMSLDLELNLLPCDHSVKKTNAKNELPQRNSPSGDLLFVDSSVNDKKNTESGMINRCPSWLAFDGEQQQQEMVATVCMRCHMLVMLCKSSPSCPNCKFMHPPDQKPANLFKQRLGLLC